MPSLLIHSAKGDRHLSIAEGQSVRAALDLTDLRVRAACGGIGSCGACVVRVLAGEVNPLTVAEYQKLSAEQRSSGIRLSCQLRLHGDAEIELEQAARPSPWRSINSENLQPLSSKLPNLTKHIYGVAVDLGTTQIRVSLLDRKAGLRIATRIGPNPQADFGADVLNRLDAAQNSTVKCQELARLARMAIVQAVRDMLARDVGEVRPMLAQIGSMLIVGNTAMLALLAGHSSGTLLDPLQWQTQIDCRPEDGANWQAHWFMPHARIELAQPLAGFVGSDLLADLLATGMTKKTNAALLLDIGTNTEIALWDGKQFYVTSVPGGPAFEGVGIRHGMPFEPGAIYSVNVTEEGFLCRTVQDEEPRGFCGSGLVDAVAVLRASGVLKPSGRFAVPLGGEGYALDPAHVCTALFGSDIDALQRAKAACASAMEQLLRLAGLGWKDVQHVYVCGAFGRQLTLVNAQAIGLLPQVAPDKITLCADAALAGAELALLDAQGSVVLAGLAKKTTLINLSFVPEYDDCYIAHLRLQPITPEA